MSLRFFRNSFEMYLETHSSMPPTTPWQSVSTFVWELVCPILLKCFRNFFNYSYENFYGNAFGNFFEIFSEIFSGSFLEFFLRFFLIIILIQSFLKLIWQYHFRISSVIIHMQITFPFLISFEIILENSL